MDAIFGTCGVFVGCMTNALYLEFLIKDDPGIGNLVTFSQFLLITIIGFLTTSKFGTAKRHIPIKNYFFVVLLFFTCNVCNNLAFDYKISMPLHMIFRSGSLIFNMIMTIVILKRRYSSSKYLSVSLVTLGVIICTVASGKEMKGAEVVEQESFFQWLLGICLLIFGLFVSSLLGIFQENLFKTYGKHPQEALFYTHMLSLPVFLFFSENIWEHWIMALNKPTILFSIMNVKFTSTIVYLIGNVITQYLCISSVYYLTTEASTLTVTLVITLRKFVSLLLSIVFFQNSFSLVHWIGTLLVFIGTIIYTELPQKLKVQ